MQKSGFTLLELSIVIVIIGLIVAGVSAGQSLVKQSQLRAVYSDFSKYRVAFTAFRLQYDALPGDMEKAYDYFGSALGCTDANVNTTIAGCNGDGNQKIGNITTAGEGLRAWQHLQQANLIEGNFLDTVTSTSSVAFVLGRDVPRAPLPNTGWQWAADVAPSENHLRLGGEAFGSATSVNVHAIKPADAHSLDVKHDDGAVSTGQLQGINAHNGSSWQTNCVSAGEYNLTYDSLACRLFFFGL